MFNARRLCVSLNSRLESNKKEKWLDRAKARLQVLQKHGRSPVWVRMCLARLLHYELVLRRNKKRFRGGLVFEAHRLLYHSTLGLRVIKKKRRSLLDTEKALAQVLQVHGRSRVQGYLAHKKQPPPQGHHRALGIILLKGPRGGWFLMSEGQG